MQFKAHLHLHKRVLRFVTHILQCASDSASRTPPRQKITQQGTGDGKNKGKGVPVYAVNSMINLRHYMEVGFQLHAPAALPLGKEPTVPTECNESVHFG